MKIFLSSVFLASPLYLSWYTTSNLVSMLNCLFNPRMILDMTNPHTSEVAGYTIDENGRKLGFINQTNNPPSCNIIRCNHYVTKSFDEFMTRCNKGDACYENMADSPKAQALNRFNIHNRNEVYDDIMDKYVEKLKQQS